MNIKDHIDFLIKFKDDLFVKTEDVFNGTSHISIKEFFKEMYVDFIKIDEKRVKNIIDSSNRIYLLYGPKGNGKTTILIHHLIEDLSKDFDFLYFDIYEIRDELYSLDKEKIEKHEKESKLIDLIEKNIKHKLEKKFILPNFDIQKKFYFNLLNLFYPKILEKFKNIWRKKYDNPKIGEDKDKLFRVFEGNFKEIYEDKEIKSIFEDELKCGKIIIAIKKAICKSRLLLIIDNIDQLVEFDLLNVLVGKALAIHSSGQNNFGTLILARDKNSIKIFEGSSGEYIEPIPLDLTRAPDSFLKDILSKRQVFTVKHEPKIEESRLQYKKSANVFNIIFNRIKNQFISTKLLRLTNNNLREVIKLNYEFTDFLLNLVCKKIIKINSRTLFISEPNLISYLYRFLSSKGVYISPFLLDIVIKYTQYLNGILKNPFECDIELIILAFLVKHEEQLRKNDLIKSFNTIGIAEGIVLNNLYNLYNKSNFAHKYVEIGNSEKHFKLNDLRNNNLLVKVTPLGKEFVESTMNQIEFIHQCIAYPEKLSINSPEMLIPIDHKIEEKIDLILEYLRTMKRVHIESLSIIKKEYNPKKKEDVDYYLDWEKYYRKHFCIDNKLIIERIVLSHLAHLFKNYSEPPYDKFYKEYKEKYINLVKEYYIGFNSSFKIENLFKIYISKNQKNI